MEATLRPAIVVTGTEYGVTLHDSRTGLTLRIEQGAGPIWHHRSAEGALAELLVAIGFAGEELALDELADRQRSYRRWLASEALERDLASIHAHALSCVPYYRERAAAHALAGPVLQAWTQLPILEKADVRRSFDALLDDSFPMKAGLASGELALVTTSGTTGDTVQSLIVHGLLGFPPACVRQWGLAELERPVRMVVLTSPSCSIAECRVETSSYEARLENGSTLHLRASSDLFSTSDRLIEETAREVERFAPDLIYANPIYLHWYLRRASELGARWPECPVIISSFQLLSVFQQRALERLLGGRVINNYTATELGGAQVAIESRCGYWHVRQDHCYVEIVDASGAPLGTGPGALLVTTHQNRVMPLLRYRIGDVAALDASTCECELAHWPCLRILGRAQDMVPLAGVWRTSSELDRALAPCSGIDFYQVEQRDLDELTVRVLPPRGHQPDALAIEQALRALGANRVLVEVVDRLELAPSLKLRQTFTAAREAPSAP